MAKTNADAVVSGFLDRIDEAEKKRNHELNNFIKFIGIVAVIGIIWMTCVVSVPAGNVGVLETFGNVQSDELPSGMHFKLPWQHVSMFSTKTIELAESADTPTDEGLLVGLDVSILYHIEPANASDIYKTIGANYETVVIEPTFRSEIRGITAGYDAKALYTSDREEIAGRIREALTTNLAKRGIIVENILLRSVRLPESVQEGIENKLVAQQEAARMEFILEREELEADRKVVEAHGIADAQGIIDQSLTPQYLSWYWISNLDKYEAVIYVPIGQNGMPLFKDVDNIDEWGMSKGAFNTTETGE